MELINLIQINLIILQYQLLLVLQLNGLLVVQEVITYRLKILAVELIKLIF